MAIIEKIPGQRALPGGVIPDNLIESPILDHPIQITDLYEQDIPEMIGLLHRGLDATSDEFLSTTDKDNFRNLRTADYYEEALKNSQYHKIFVARDESDGNRIIGGLETTRFEVDGCQVGFINWINTDPAVRNGNIALELYRHYEEYAQQEGFTFLMANVHHNNRPSLALHRRAGFRETPYLRKPKEANSNWYVKQINPMPDEVMIPITETDYLSQSAVDALSTIAFVMRTKRLGIIGITDHEMKNEEGGVLVSAAAANSGARETLQILFSSVADIVSPDRSQDYGKRTQAHVRRRVLLTAKNLR